MTIFKTTASTDTGIVAATSGDTWLIAANTYVTTSGTAAIDASATANGRQIYVDGHIIADAANAAILLGGGSGNALVIGAAASVAGDNYGVDSSSQGFAIDNRGAIFGATFGVIADGFADGFKMTNAGSIGGLQAGLRLDADDAKVLNTGDIHSRDFGIWVTGARSTITNDGTVSATGTAIFLGANTDQDRLVNSGHITATYAIAATDNFDTVVNSGTITGHIDLGNGSDTFNNSGRVDGNVIMGGGDDTLSLSGAGSINGDVDMGDGNDAANIRKGDISGMLSGGIGNDTYYIDTRDVSLLEGTDAGNDTIVTSLTWRLASNFENLTLTGIDNVRAFGNERDNQLFGNGGDNLIMGEEGNDMLKGGKGADRLDGGTGIDMVDYSTSRSGVVIDLAKGRGSGGEAQGDTLVGIENVNASEQADTLRGNGSANTLYGSAGDDILDGRGGNDFLEGGGGSDTFVFGTHYGHDTIAYFEYPSDAHDVIDLSHAAGITSYRDLVKNHLATTADAFVITAADGATLTILKDGDATAALHSYDFHF